MPVVPSEARGARTFVFTRCPLAARDVALVTTRDVAADPARPNVPDPAFLRGIGLDAADLAISGQVHGRRILALSRAGSQGSADALITNRGGIVLSIRTADCVPVFFVDPKRRVLGLAHAGWRGTHLGIAGDTVRAMASLYGTDPGDLWVGLGPAIGPCCYEVDRDVHDAFEGRRLTPRGTKWMLDLPGALLDDLCASGVPAVNVERSDECTMTRNDVYVSYRAERSGGRLFSLLGFDVKRS